MTSTETKIIARFMVALTETSDPTEAIIATEDAMVADLRAIGSTTPEEGIRAIVRGTVTKAILAL